MSSVFFTPTKKPTDPVTPVTPDENPFFVIGSKEAKQSKNKRNASFKPILSMKYENNVVHLHEMILSYLEKKIENLSYFQEQLKRRKWIAEKGLEEDRVHAQYEAQQLEIDIEGIETTLEYAFYIHDTSKIIDKYVSILKTNSSFFSKTSESNIGSRQLKTLEIKFIIAASKYMKITNVNQTTKDDCSQCMSSEIDIKNDTIVCKNCGLTWFNIQDELSFKDTTRVGVTSKYTYSKRDHFISAMRKFQAKQHVKIDDALFDHVHRQMDYNNLEASDLTKDQLYGFLSSFSGDKKHYEDINFIHYTITGTDPPNISLYESDLLKMFDDHERIDSQKEGSQQVYFRLFKYLEYLGYKCSRREFYILRTHDKLIEHDEKWKDDCKKLGWKYIKTM